MLSPPYIIVSSTDTYLSISDVRDSGEMAIENRGQSWHTWEELSGPTDPLSHRRMLHSVRYRKQCTSVCRFHTKEKQSGCGAAIGKHIVVAWRDAYLWRASAIK